MVYTCIALYYFLRRTKALHSPSPVTHANTHIHTLHGRAGTECGTFRPKDDRSIAVPWPLSLTLMSYDSEVWL